MLHSLKLVNTFTNGVLGNIDIALMSILKFNFVSVYPDPDVSATEKHDIIVWISQKTYGDIAYGFYVNNCSILQASGSLRHIFTRYTLICKFRRYVAIEMQLVYIRLNWLLYTTNFVPSSDQ